jgi:hypothetical protein
VNVDPSLEKAENPLCKFWKAADFVVLSRIPIVTVSQNCGILFVPVGRGACQGIHFALDHVINLHPLLRVQEKSIYQS